MTPERWQDVSGNVKDNFEVIDLGSEHIAEEGGVDIEYIVFEGPLGKMRLEYVTKPMILDKKTNYSNRIGSETQIIYDYSETEKTHKLNVYKWDEVINDWVEIEAKGFLS